MQKELKKNCSFDSQYLKEEELTAKLANTYCPERHAMFNGNLVFLVCCTHMFQEQLHNHYTTP
jgi:hypothetical protein